MPLVVALATAVAMFLQAAGPAGIALAVASDTGHRPDGIRPCEGRWSPACAGIIAALGGGADAYFLEDEP
jgi:hypothetical protein